jgi:molybdopterin converting factor small subunit
MAAVEVVLPGVLADDAGGVRHLRIEVDDDIAGSGPSGVRLARVIDELARRYPLLGRRLRDEAGVVRRHVNLFVDGDDVRTTGGQETRVRDGATLLVLPNVAGG